MHTDIHVLSGIRTHDPSVQTGEDGSCLRPRGHCDRQENTQVLEFTTKVTYPAVLFEVKLILKCFI
jgi:hypothetical protein